MIHYCLRCQDGDHKHCVNVNLGNVCDCKHDKASIEAIKAYHNELSEAKQKRMNVNQRGGWF